MALTRGVQKRRESPLADDVRGTPAARVLVLLLFLCILVDSRLVHLAPRAHGGLNLCRCRRPCAVVRERCEHIRIPSACGAVDRALGAQIEGLGGEVRIRSPFQKRVDRVYAIPGSRKDQRRLLPLGLTPVDIGSGLDEYVDDGRVTGSGGQMQRRGAAGNRRGADVGAGGEQDGDYLRDAISARDVEWRILADTSNHIDCGTRVEQHLGELGVATLGSPVQRAHAVALRCVDVRTLAEKLTHRVDVSPHRRIRHRSVRRAGADEDSETKST